MILITLIALIIGMWIGIYTTGKILKPIYKRSVDDTNKYQSMYFLMNRWLQLKQEGRNVKDYFEKNNLTKIAIYGWNDIGIALMQELKDSSVEVSYIIDQNKEGVSADRPVVSPKDELLTVDAIVVAPIFYYDSIEKMLEEKCKMKIISMEDVIDEM